MIEVVIIGLCLLIVSGCAHDSFHYADETTAAYADNEAKVSQIPSSGTYIVNKGDTLFAIAFRYGLDYRDLAAINGIESPYTIYPQQKIRLKGGAKTVTSLSSMPVIVNSVEDIKPASPTIATPVSLPKVRASQQANTPITVPQVTTQSSNKIEASAVVERSLAKPVVTKVEPITDKSTAPVVSVSVVQEEKNIPPSVVVATNHTPEWRWPIDGEVVRGFSNAGVSSKGIDIKGSIGKHVQAAADGVVVYAGNGLIGYGNLVIVKHSDIYLSAYAYNQSILVKEQQQVKGGDSLAIIGGKGNEKPLLHFEIRRDGQPVDPLKLLPKQ